METYRPWAARLRGAPFLVPSFNRPVLMDMRITVLIDDRSPGTDAIRDGQGLAREG